MLKTTAYDASSLFYPPHYDQRGQLTDILTGVGEYHYHYDAAGRLSKAQSAYYQTAYHYDPAGNQRWVPPAEPDGTPAPILGLGYSQLDIL